jgi:hypothetical protein
MKKNLNSILIVYEQEMKDAVEGFDIDNQVKTISAKSEQC